MITSVFKSPQHLNVVQVGSNDGITGDPLRPYIEPYGWGGILIEPVPSLFHKLQKLYYNNPRIRTWSVAIGACIGITTFYYVPDDIHLHVPDLPAWVTQLGSFSKDHITKHCDGKLNDHVQSMTINVMTLNDVLEIMDDPVDLIHIDAEGHDYDILHTIDFTVHKPSAIMFEHYHMTDDQKESVIDLLHSAGYIIARCGHMDTIVVDPSHPNIHYCSDLNTIKGSMSFSNN